MDDPYYVQRRRFRNIDLDSLNRLQEEDIVNLRKTIRYHDMSIDRKPILTTHSDEVFSALVDVMYQGFSKFSNDHWAKKCQIEAMKSMAVECPSTNVIDDYKITLRYPEFLSHDDPQVQLAAVSILNRIAGGTSTHKDYIVRGFIVPCFVDLLSSSRNDNIREEAISALGFIAMESSNYRDKVLKLDVLPLLLSLLNPQPRLSMVRVITWTLSNLVCVGEPPVDFEKVVKPMLPVLHQHLIYQIDEGVIADAWWALFYLSRVSVYKIEDIIDTQVCQKLVELLKFQLDAAFVLPALGTIGNIVFGDDAQTQHLIDNGVLKCIPQLLEHEYSNTKWKKRIHSEASWIIANIVGGNISQIEAVIEANIIPTFIQLLEHAQLHIKREFSRMVLNVSARKSHDHIRYLVQVGCIKEICDLLRSYDPQVLTMCLDGLDSILYVGLESETHRGPDNSLNNYVQSIEECDGTDRIRNLISHRYQEISLRARLIRLIYFH